jgi:hypothetical protein
MNAHTSPDWRGTRHARIPRSILAARIPKSAKECLVALRYLIPDGETKRISHDTIARRAGLSEGSVSPAMKILAGEHPNYPHIRFVTRDWQQDGHGQPGFAITMLPPPELRKTASVAPIPGVADPGAGASFCAHEGSESDPVDHEANVGSADQHAEDSLGSDSDPSNLQHAWNHEQQQHVGLVLDDGDAEYRAAGEEAPADIPQEAFISAWRQIQVTNPRYSARDFRKDLDLAAERPDVRDPIRLVVAVRSRGEPLYSQEALNDRAATIAGRGRESAGDPGQHRPERSAGDRHRHPGAGASRARRPPGEAYDKYGVGAAYRTLPPDEELPSFLRAAAERAKVGAPTPATI